MSELLKVQAKFHKPEVYPLHHQIIGETVDFASEGLRMNVKSLFYTSGDGSLEVQFIRMNDEPFSPDDRDSLENKMSSFGAFADLSVSLS